MAERCVDIADDSESGPHQRAAEAFARRVQERGVQRVEDLILFGSTVRGDARGIDSDIDFLAIVSDDADRVMVADELRDVAYDVMLEFGPVVEVHVLSRTEFERRHEQGNPFVRNVLGRDGRMPEADEPSREEIEKQLRKADEALEDAEGALGAGLSETVVVNRLYYACFHAAQAALSDRGHNPESHRGVLSLFGSEIVVDGAASREQGRFLNHLSDLRRQADYGYESIEEDLNDLFAATRTFVSDMRSVVTDE